MRRHFNHKAPITRFSLVLAVLAIFAVATLETIELSHQHLAGDVADNCMMCKVDSGAKALSSTTVLPLARTQTVLMVSRTTAISINFVPYHQARAPPIYS